MKPLAINNRGYVLYETTSLEIPELTEGLSRDIVKAEFPTTIIDESITSDKEYLIYDKNSEQYLTNEDF